jgi:hypothetical protein
VTCYICDLDRVTPEAQAMSDDEYGEGCTDCEREFWQWVAGMNPQVGDGS